jgi:NAD-dependent deacetylase
MFLPTTTQLINRLREARHIVAFTGAGVSAESGVATFRDALTGLWSNFDPAQLATAEAFDRDPELVSRWYDERRCTIAKCVPNPGHVSLAALQRHTLARNAEFTLITQNIDRLHQAAGSNDVIELHGSIWIWRCLKCSKETEEKGPAFETYPPLCPCGGQKRPGVVWFGENLPEEAFWAAKRAAGLCDLFISLGTSSVVQPAARLIDHALLNHAKLVEVNPESTPYTRRAHWFIKAPSGEVLPELIAAAFGR